MDTKDTAILEVNSRVMPYKKDTILINGEHVAKRHMLSSKFETYMRFQTANLESTRHFTIFLKMMINLSYRLVCVGIKVYNLEQKLNALNKLAILLITETSSTVRQMLDMTVYPSEAFPERKCCTRLCKRCWKILITEMV